MGGFVRGDLDVLVATTIVEVGVEIEERTNVLSPMSIVFCPGTDGSAPADAWVAEGGFTRGSDWIGSAGKDGSEGTADAGPLSSVSSASRFSGTVNGSTIGG